MYCPNSNSLKTFAAMARDAYGTMDALKAALAKPEFKVVFVAKLGEADSDMDGAVTRDEFAAAVPAVGELFAVSISADEARALFGLLDIMGDGALKTAELLVALDADGVSTFDSLVPSGHAGFVDWLHHAGKTEGTQHATLLHPPPGGNGVRDVPVVADEQGGGVTIGEGEDIP